MTERKASKGTYGLKYVLVSCGWYKKSPQIWWLKAIEMYSLSPESKMSEIRVSAGPPSIQSCGEWLFSLPLLPSCDCWRSLAYSHITPIFSSFFLHITVYIPLCLLPLLSHIRMLVLSFRTCLVNLGRSYLKILNYTWKDFWNKVTITGSKDLDVDISFRDHHSTHHSILMSLNFLSEVFPMHWIVSQEL